MSEKKPTYFLHNINKIGELNSTQCRILMEIAELSKLKNYCYASNNYISKRINMSKITVRKTVKKLEELGFINSVQDFGKPSKKFLTKKTYAVITDVYYVSKFVKPRYTCITSPDTLLSHHPDTNVSPIQESITNNNIHKEQFFSCSIDPCEIASAISQIVISISDTETIKEESETIPSGFETKFKGFAQMDLLNNTEHFKAASYEIIRQAEKEGISALNLTSDKEKVRELLKGLEVNLNGKFHTFYCRFIDVASDYSLNASINANRNCFRS